MQSLAGQICTIVAEITTRRLHLFLHRILGEAYEFIHYTVNFRRLRVVLRRDFGQVIFAIFQPLLHRERLVVYCVVSRVRRHLVGYLNLIDSLIYLLVQGRLQLKQLLE